MIALPYVLIALFIAFFCFDTKKAIMVAVMIRPIIECFYKVTYGFAGVRPPEFFGFLLPTLICMKILMSRDKSFTRAPLSYLWIFYIYFQLFGTALILTVGNDALLGADYFYRALNGFVGFYLFQEFFKTKEDFRSLLLAHLVAGLAPLGMSAYQNILGGAIRSEATIGTLVRNIGFYHDAYTLRLYCFQTLAAALLYWCYFLSGTRRIISRAILLVMSAVALLGIFKLYSKAGYMVIAEWLVVWYVGRRQFLQLGVLVLAILVLCVTMRGQLKILDTLDTVYSKEVGAMQGKEKSDRLFQGRVGGWKAALKEFEQSSIALQLVGDGSSHTGAHNDFLRALLGTGIFGLLLYCALLVSIGVRTVVNCVRQQTPLNIMAVMLIGMWLVDAMGLVPGAYPGYQIFVWGFIGLALRGVEGLETTAKAGSSQRTAAFEQPLEENSACQI